jgi:predicted phosphodiesterase
MKIGIVTDIHENAMLLEEALRVMALSKCDEIVCLGDIVGYDSRFYRYDDSRSAKKCVRLIRSTCRWVTAGNHDLYAARVFPSYSNGFSYPDNWYDLDPFQRKIISAGKVWCYEGEATNDLSGDDISYLRSIPEYIITDQPGLPCLFTHYFAPDFTGSTTTYIERGSQLKYHWQTLKNKGAGYSFSGHCHSHFTGFAYKSGSLYSKAIHSFSGNRFNLGKEMVAVILPPLSGEKGRRGFSILDTDNMVINILSSL